MNEYKFYKNTFYAYALRTEYESAGSWPAVGVDVSESVFTEFTGSAPIGKIRIVGPDGLPAWGDIPPPTPEELQQIAESQKRQLMRVAREKIDIYQDAVDFSMATEVEKSALVAWRKYRVELYQVETSTAPDIQWPEQPK
ncbi:tail fiber assembly protein [Xenorhabdus sp. IM139775]|uniref:tail fiber assembly protein n=1 Tax=Xenorhabdus sp. IM139775 TaxID=3025876 RepID=UPI0023583726|nr:tail fiber assembly protein [Xenorhabdus sp. IM139775]MDC9595134.1 tail fiber assembly protein [Xenorhabdus sp. IM139775]